MFSLTVIIVVKPEYQDQMATLLKEASHVYVKDKGTLGWYVNQHVDNKNQFSIYEFYENEDSLATHIANPFYSQFGARSKVMVESIDIQKWNSIPGSVV